ncbi:MAG: hypothetical protein JOZ75_12065 [Candidatus Dormibacteraeota bacterium]|nr:hypothetical protein [Candidatus Dormibacteraeota bacterium]
MTLSSEAQEATLRRLRSVLANSGEAREQKSSRPVPRRSWDAKALAKQAIRRGIAWYVDATARAAAREATDALYQRISMELLRSGSQEDPRVLAINQELMKGELRSMQRALDELGRGIARIPQTHVRRAAIERELRGGGGAAPASRAERYAAMVRGHDPVLALGSERGPEDAIQALHGASPGSLGAIVCIHLVEWLELGPLLEVLELGVARLRPGGVFIAETDNPASLVVLSSTAAHDATPARLLHPSVLAFLCERAGFDTVELRYFTSVNHGLHPITADDAPQWVEQINDSLKTLNDVLFGPQEYAVVARLGPA